MLSKKLTFLFGAIIALSMVAANADEVKLVETCVVNGDRFAERKNPPVKVSYEGSSIMVCCRKCAKKFQDDPAKYVKLYQEELAKESAAKK